MRGYERAIFARRFDRLDRSLRQIRERQTAQVGVSRIATPHRMSIARFALVCNAVWISVVAVCVTVALR